MQVGCCWLLLVAWESRFCSKLKLQWDWDFTVLHLWALSPATTPKQAASKSTQPTTLNPQPCSCRPYPSISWLSSSPSLSQSEIVRLLHPLPSTAQLCTKYLCTFHFVGIITVHVIAWSFLRSGYRYVSQSSLATNPSCAPNPPAKKKQLALRSPPSARQIGSSPKQNPSQIQASRFFGITQC